MAEVRLGCAALDGADVQSVVEGVPSAAEIGEASATLEEASEDQILVVCGGSVVGYSTIRRWQERDDTWLYLHRGWLLPEHRRQGIGSAMLRWAEDRIRRLVAQHGTAGTAVIGANAMASERDATALLLAVGLPARLQPGRAGVERSAPAARPGQRAVSRDTDGTDRSAPLP